MASGTASPSSSDSLEERLTRILPRLRAHLARRERRIRGCDPEDVAQEVLARALRYRESYDGSRELWPWLRRVAEHVLHDHRASGARRPVELPLAPGDLDASEPARTPTADAREELERVLARLRPLEREVLLRFHQRGDSVRDIAAALDMPAGTVKSHLSRARRRLAQLEDPEEDDG